MRRTTVEVFRDEARVTTTVLTIAENLPALLAVPELAQEAKDARDAAQSAQSGAQLFAEAAQSDATTAGAAAGAADTSASQAANSATQAAGDRAASASIKNDVQGLKDDTEAIRVATAGLRDETANIRDATAALEVAYIGYRDAAAASASAAGVSRTGADAARAAADLAAAAAAVAQGFAEDAQSAAQGHETASGLSAADAWAAYQATLGAQATVQQFAVFLGMTTTYYGTRAGIPAGWRAYDGELLNRSEYPEIWAGISSGRFPSVTDAVWLSSADYRASYSLGNGTTTFRLPDLNGKQAGSRSPFMRGDGYDAAIGKVVGDAIRDITAEFATDLNGMSWLPAIGRTGGAITQGLPQVNNTFKPNGGTFTSVNGNAGTFFKASNMVPTADENRPVFAVGVVIGKVRGGLAEVLTPETYATLAANIFTGRQRMNGGLDVYSGAIVNGELEAKNALVVRGIANLMGGTAITGNGTVSGTFSVGGKVTMGGGLDVSGRITSPSIFIEGHQSAGFEMRAQAGGIAYIDMTPNGWADDFTYRLHAGTDGNFRIDRQGQGQILQLNSDGNLWLKPFGFLSDQLSAKECQHNSGTWEIGSIDVDASDITIDCPNPWTVNGLRSVPLSRRVFVRAVTMRSR